MDTDIFFQKIRVYGGHLSQEAEAEQHWIIEKEPFEISLRYDEAKTRYEEFLVRYPNLAGRLKKHHIAAYLGITPTQLSSIFFSNK